MWDTLKTPGEGELEATTLVAATYYTVPVKLMDGMTTHAFQYKIASAGATAVTITPYTSITQQNWVSGGAKLSAASKTSGPDSDGIDTIPMSVKPGEFIKFKILVETATAVLTLEFVQK